jgi:hypothetical protein
MRGLVALLGAGFLLLGGGASRASDLNEVGAFLVYPLVASSNDRETFLTVTNTSSSPTNVHVAVIEGVGTPTSPECSEYNRTISLTGFDTETLVLGPTQAGGTNLESLDSTFSFSVPVTLGFITMNTEDPADGDTTQNNYLMGSEVVVDYALGYAYSIDAIPFQGLPTGDDNRRFNFNGVEYEKLPRRVAVEFIAPDGPGSFQEVGGITAELALFTLAFEAGFPPATSCTGSGFDARENPISFGFQFGCWTLFDLTTVPELAYPELGDAGTPDNHGWLSLNCSVVGTGASPQPTTSIAGAVHGALIQTGGDDVVIERPSGSNATGAIAWSRLLWQSLGETAPSNLILTLNKFVGFP